MRLSCFDIARALAIFLVVFGHVLVTYHPMHYQSVVAEYIYSFHTAFFMFISGCFLSNALKKDLKPLLLQKTKQLMVPYLSWCLICFFVFSIPLGHFNVKDLLGGVVHGYWYIKLLFLYTLIIAVFYKFFKNELIACIASLLLFLCLPSFSFSAIFIPFLLAGYVYKEFLFIRMNNKIFVALIVVLFLLYLIWRPSYNYNVETNLHLFSYIIRTSIGIIASICIIHCVKLIEPLINNKLKGVIVYIGMNTLGIYLCHILFYSRTLWNWLFDYFPNNTIVLFLYSIFVLFASVSLVATIARNRITSNLFLGKE